MSLNKVATGLTQKSAQIIKRIRELSTPYLLLLVAGFVLAIMIVAVILFDRGKEVRVGPGGRNDVKTTTNDPESNPDDFYLHPETVESLDDEYNNNDEDVKGVATKEEDIRGDYKPYYVGKKADDIEITTKAKGGLQRHKVTKNELGVELHEKRYDSAAFIKVLEDEPIFQYLDQNGNWSNYEISKIGSPKISEESEDTTVITQSFEVTIPDDASATQIDSKDTESTDSTQEETTGADTESSEETEIPENGAAENESLNQGHSENDDPENVQNSTESEDETSVESDAEVVTPSETPSDDQSEKEFSSAKKIKGEISIRIGFSGDQHISKITFNLEENDNTNRMVWKIHPDDQKLKHDITAKKDYDELKETAKIESDDVLIDWSDFGSDDISVKTGNQDDPYLQVMFHPDGQKGEIVIDPTVSITVASSYIQIDITDRYRARVNIGTSNDTLVHLYDRAENNTSPDNTVSFVHGLRVRDENVYYYLSEDSTRRTTVLETTPTRAVIRIEGYLSNTSETSYLVSSTNERITGYVTYTFTPEHIGIDAGYDMKAGVTIDTIDYSDRVDTLSIRFNEEISSAYSETIIYGDGVTEGTRGSGDGDGACLSETDGYITLQATGSYQDAIFAEMDKNGDRWLSNAEFNGNDYYNIDKAIEKDLYTNRETPTQTLRDEGSTQFIFSFQEQSALDTELERESFYNDYANHDYITLSTGNIWYDKPDSGGMEFGGGTSSYIDMKDVYDVSDGDNFKIEAWIYGIGSFGGSSDSTIVAKSDGQLSTDGPGYIFWVDSSDQKLYYSVRDTDGDLFKVSGTTPLQQEKWYHVVAIFDQSSDTDSTILLNGVDDKASTSGSLPDIGDLSNSKDFRIGSESDNEYPFTGRMDEVRLWSAPYDYTHTQLLMFKEYWGNDNALIGEWHLNEGQNSVVHDYCRIADGTLGSGASWSTGKPADLFNEGEIAYTAEAQDSFLKLDLDGGSNVSTRANGTIPADASSITVDSTTGFPSSGIAYAAGDKFNYENTTATTFYDIASGRIINIESHLDNTEIVSANRHKPTIKYRKYRSITKPNKVKLEGSKLNDGSDYNLNIKPVTDAYFAQDISFYAPLENTTANIGSNLTNSGCTFEEARYGKGLKCNDSSEDATFSSSDNFDEHKGYWDFWMKTFAQSTDDRTHVFIYGTDRSLNKFYLQKTSSNTLEFTIIDGGTEITESISSSNYYWAENDWVHIRLEWDADATTSDQQKIFINGEEPVHSDSMFNYDGTLGITSFTLGNNGNTGTVPCNCIMDEMYIYDLYIGGEETSNNDVTKLAEGGDTSDADEYLFDASNNFTLSLSTVDSEDRGEYLYLGSDSMVSGYNFDLDTNGVGSSLDIIWSYWDGNGWGPLESTSGFSDQTSNLTSDGSIYWESDPTNWTPYSFWGSTDLYYIRAALSSKHGNYTTDPVENAVTTDTILVQYLSDITNEDQTFEIYSNTDPNSPQTPYCNNTTAQSGQATPVTGLTDHTPAFSAIFDDTDTSDTAEYYEIEVGDDTNWADGAEMWDSGKTSQTSCNENSRCADIIYAGSVLTDGTTYYWRIRFWDQKGDASSWSSDQTFSMNSPPAVSNISVNSGSNIELSENSTVSVTWSGTATDADGYTEIEGTEGVLYRSGATGAEGCTPDNNNCYQDSSCSLSGCSGTTCTVSCSVDMQFHADPTDSGSTYSSEYWRGWIELTDTYAETGSGHSPTDLPDVSTLRAVAVSASIDYGSLTAGENTGSSNESTTITNTGNAPIDAEVSGSNMCTDYPTCSGFTLLVSLQEYGLTTFTYGSGTDLSSTPAAIDISLSKPTQSPSDSFGYLYWGISIPSGSGVGDYTGENAITVTDDL